MKNFARLMSSLVLGLASVAPAQYAYMDNAAQAGYDSGWVNGTSGSYGTLSFSSTWLATDFLAGTSEAVSATTIPGAWSGMDTAGRSWLITLPDATFLSMVRVFPTTAEGQVAQLNLQFVSSVTSDFTIALYNGSTSSTDEVFRMTAPAGGNFLIVPSPANPSLNVDTAVSTSEAYTLRFIDELLGTTGKMVLIPRTGGGTTEVFDVDYQHSKTKFDRILITGSNTSGTASSAYLLTNNLWLDLSGGLPVELDSFLIE